MLRWLNFSTLLWGHLRTQPISPQVRREKDGSYKLALWALTKERPGLWKRGIMKGDAVFEHMQEMIRVSVGLLDVLDISANTCLILGEWCIPLFERDCGNIRPLVIMSLNGFFVVVCLFLDDAPQWGAANAEIKVPSSENTELKPSPF